ncbi:MAG TPA: tRNA adenosine(34) deaminase TadA [Bacillota bacterium]|nr:tRNA adenosine(34) deaminase TadA [Bacillota bacterium]
MDDDQHWMDVALAEALAAGAAGEVPVGCVIVRDGAELGRGRNRRQELADPTAHAEILALRGAGATCGTWHLDGATLFVTLEPCPMCAGALVLARIARLVYGAADPKAGAAGSLFDIVRDCRLNHRLEVAAGVGAEASAALLRAFFRSRRGSAGGDPQQP